MAALAAASVAQGRDFDVPRGAERQEASIPDFRTAPTRQDLQGLVKHLGSCIADPVSPRDGAPNIDQFVGDLEANLRQGNDLPRDRILRNAALAREALRLAYNDLTVAASPDMLQRVRDDLKAIADALPPLSARNRASVAQLAGVAGSGRSTAGAIQIEPPESPGPEVPLAVLASIQPLRPDLLPLREKVKTVLKRLAKAKGYIARAKDQAAYVDTVAQRAGRLDEQALGHLDDRRTRGTRERYETQMLSREVILNADKWLKDAVKKSEDVERLLEAQADPKADGVRKALDAAFEADRLTQDGKELETRSGNRINFNHTKRLNDVIQRGYEIATDARKPWWVGRARMALSECQEDAGKMDDARQAADDGARSADAALAAGRDAVARADEALGRSEEPLPRLKRLELDVPPPRDPGGEPVAAGPRVKSKALKVPHTFDVSNDEIIGSFDTGGR